MIPLTIPLTLLWTCNRHRGTAVSLRADTESSAHTSEASASPPPSYVGAGGTAAGPVGGRGTKDVHTYY